MPVMSRPNDQIAIVTGGSSGIGHAIAVALAERGAQVLITGRGAAALERTAALHANIVGLRADSAEPRDATRTVEKVVELWGGLDLLVNNAGAGDLLPLGQATADRITAMFADNVLGPSLLTAAALPLLSKSRGVVVNISSTYGHKPVAHLSHYAASKAALEHLARCRALEPAPQGIRVNAVAAGPTESGALTGMMGLSPRLAAEIKEQERQRIPLGRRGMPHDLARWVIALADPMADWITGQIITVDGGLELT
jgi:NAD(P)-dependent dehydrogenase (short-subunit alcohol dehydrogenase family)